MRPSDHDPLHDHAAPEFAPPPRPAADAVGRAVGWVGGHARILLTLAVMFQVAVLLGLVVMASRPLVASGSRVVLLHVVPVDPRDLFRGDYVTLSYDLSRVDSTLTPGQTVYVELVAEPDGRHYRAGGRTTTDPNHGPGVWLRGTVMRPGFAEFGLEKFFVPEGQGRDYENAARDRRLWAEAAVAPDGSSGLLRLVVEP